MFNFRVLIISGAKWFQKTSTLECLRTFVKGTGEGDMLVVHVQDPFRRLLLHGVCEFYDLVSVTVTKSKDGKMSKMTRIKKKKSGSMEVPNISLSYFLKMLKEGLW
ncbi:hypothetical protein IFM89_017571 [Coptis chinensis]|uniref:Uncharacterized protein n=1 Tax=Coptis chinensis TaxID=261450 RepID=A0A835HW92_9MAGN|nr:hypothetical protein IFM89_017571 [Coptis chinensis]